MSATPSGPPQARENPAAPGQSPTAAADPQAVDLEALRAAVRDQVARKRVNGPPLHEILGAFGPAGPAEGVLSGETQGMTHAPANSKGGTAAIPWGHVEAQLATLKDAAAVGNGAPDMRHRRGAKRWLARGVARCVAYLTRFITTRQSSFNTAAADSARALGQAVRALEQALEEQARRQEQAVDQILEEQARCQHFQSQQALQNLSRRLEAKFEEQTQRLRQGLQDHERRLVELERDLREFHRVLQQQQRHCEAVTAQEAQLVQDCARFRESAEARILDVEKRLAVRLHELEKAAGQPDPVMITRIHQAEKQLSHLRTDLLCQERRTNLLLEEAGRRLPEPFNREQLEAIRKEDRHTLDSLYVAFEDQFRGSRETIKERLKVYLPHLQKLSHDADVLDVGCGRGEWLELMRDAGIVARGVDSNTAMVEQCRQRGLNVAQGDVIAHLRGLPDASLGLVTGFHIIEHLPLRVFVTLLDETLRVLKVGGLAIFETPNPQNVLVGSYCFYMDPTHRNPMPSAMVKFFAEQRGFAPVTELPLHPYPEAAFLHGSDLAERFSNHFYGPQDYAVLCWKP
jgi:O-antigen chain-terminating methyltransferase